MGYPMGYPMVGPMVSPMGYPMGYPVVVCLPKKKGTNSNIPTSSLHLFANPFIHTCFLKHLGRSHPKWVPWLLETHGPECT